MLALTGSDKGRGENIVRNKVIIFQVRVIFYQQKKYDWNQVLQ